MDEHKNQLLPPGITESANDVQMSLASAEDFRFFAQQSQNSSNDTQNTVEPPPQQHQQRSVQAAAIINQLQRYR